MRIPNSIICLKRTNIFTLTYLAEIIFPNNYMTQHYNYQFWLKIPISPRKHDTIFDEYNFSPCHKVTLSISSFYVHLMIGIFIYLQNFISCIKYDDYIFRNILTCKPLASQCIYIILYDIKYKRRSKSFTWLITWVGLKLRRANGFPGNVLSGNPE